MSRHLPQSEHEDKTCVIRRMVHEDCVPIGFVLVFACMVGKNPKTPQTEPHAGVNKDGAGSRIPGVYQCMQHKTTVATASSRVLRLVPLYTQ